MSAAIVLRPGQTPLADWRAIYGGAAVELDPVARIDVEAGRAALSAILSKNGLLPPLDLGGGSPSVAELIETRGTILPDGHLRLLVALKLASLGQGVSGVRWEVVEALADLVSGDLLPVVPEGASDRMALSNLFGAVTGTGEILYRGRIHPATEILRNADRKPLTLNPRERSALLSGTEPTLAAALAWLFTAEHIFQSAIVATALSALASGHPEDVLHVSVHRLHRQRGQMDVATVLRSLTHRDEPEETQEGASDGAGTNVDRSALFRMGAGFDLLRQAGAMLERAANSVSEDRLVIWQMEEMVSGVEDLTSVALAADLMALALTTLGSLTAARIEAQSSSGGDPDGLAERAASLAAENRERAGTPALDPAAIGRMEPMLQSLSEIVAIEFLQADRLAGETENPTMTKARRLLGEAAPNAADGTFDEHAIGVVAELVRTGVLAAAPGVALPSVAPALPASRLGARGKHP